MKICKDLWRFEIFEDICSFVNAFEVCSADIFFEPKCWVTFISKIVVLRIG